MKIRFGDICSVIRILPDVIVPIKDSFKRKLSNLSSIQIYNKILIDWKLNGYWSTKRKSFSLIQIKMI